MSTTILKLDTDFRDYYDHWFASTLQQHSITYRRKTQSGMSRPEMLRYLRDLGVTTPAFGTVRELADRMLSFAKPYSDVIEVVKDAGEVVIYTDINTHAGEGKVKIPFSEALKKHPDCFATEYIPNSVSGRGNSIRYLRIGQRQFWLGYQSADDWRSNCGSVFIKLLGEEHSITPIALIGPAPVPIFAVDFVFAEQMYAVDYNIAPMIRGTGIEDILSGKEVYMEIANWYTSTPAAAINTTLPSTVSR